MNLYDILLARCICSNKSEESIVATPLEVTENGEYEAEEGYAYNPVTVNVGGDFSTAQVTIVNNMSEQYESYLPIIVTVPEVGDVLDTLVYVSSESSETIACVLYKGETLLSTFGYTVALDGNVESTPGGVIIKGDCTITLTDAT